MKDSEKFDILVIGSGIAGLFYALKMVEKDANLKIAVVTKKGTSDSNTNRAQGGIAAVLTGTDSVKSHIKDTIDIGCGLCDKEVVAKIIELGPIAIKELINYGVKFTKTDGEFDLGREGGHSAKRVLHAGDLTGREIERAVLSACKIHSENIKIFENYLAIDLLTTKDEETKKCRGAVILEVESKSIKYIQSRVTMLATGGLGHIYLHNTNPQIATGDGVAIAYRAGVSIANLEFIQFHPTSLYSPGFPAFLISETVRGEGGRLKTVSGENIMEATHPLGDLAPRDVVAREIDKELKRTGKDFVLLDISFLESDFIKKRFPNIYKVCLKRGIDITTQPIPVVPAAHYSCGGVLAKIDGQTELPGLYVAGEVAMTGLHGANRLASNSLLEAVVMAYLSAEKSFEYFQASNADDSPLEIKENYSYNKPVRANIISHNKKLLRQIMSDFVGIVRSEKLMKMAQEKLSKIEEEIDYYFSNLLIDYNLVELRNMITVSKLVVESALKRKESRGLHFVEEYPDSKEELIKDTIVTKYQSKQTKV